MNKLIVLDINGLLCKKINKDIVYNKNLTCIPLNSYNVILRPYYKEFLNFCYTNYHVSIFTSGTINNTKIILDKLLTKEQLKLTKFIWCRDKNRLDPDYHMDIFTTSYDTIKVLQDIYDHPVINEHRIYNNNNTILLDDSYKKCRFNNINNYIICNSFNIDVNDNYLLELINILNTHAILIKD